MVYIQGFIVTDQADLLDVDLDVDDDKRCAANEWQERVERAIRTRERNLCRQKRGSGRLGAASEVVAVGRLLPRGLDRRGGGRHGCLTEHWLPWSWSAGLSGWLHTASTENRTAPPDLGLCEGALLARAVRY